MPEKNKLFYREMQLDGAVDHESRTVPISFSSEKSVKRFDWRRGEYYNEILGHEAGNVDLTRLSEMGVALFNHDTDRVIGAIIDPVLDAAEHRCKAKIRFDEDEFSEMIYQKVLRGTLKGISVGYGVGAWEEDLSLLRENTVDFNSFSYYYSLCTSAHPENEEGLIAFVPENPFHRCSSQIGRASCRERVCLQV